MFPQTSPGPCKNSQGNSEPVSQQEEVSTPQEESLIDAVTLAVDEITAVVPGQPGTTSSENAINFPTSATVTSFSPLPLKVYPKRN